MGGSVPELDVDDEEVSELESEDSSDSELELTFEEELRFVIACPLGSSQLTFER